jgi:hypothetical protein
MQRAGSKAGSDPAYPRNRGRFVVERRVMPVALDLASPRRTAHSLLRVHTGWNPTLPDEGLDGRICLLSSAVIANPQSG